MLPANSLGNLSLPADAEWFATTDAEKALNIINQERTARAVPYGDGVPLGLPLRGVETAINKLAQDYAEYMVAHDFWAHDVPASVTAPPFAGTGSFSRIDQNPIIGVEIAPAGTDCHQFLPRAENLFIFASGSSAPIPLITERALYGFIYDDASSLWGHREALLLQDIALNGSPGFDNNQPPAESEGLMGLGIAGSTDGSYQPGVFGQPFVNQQVLVWLVFDPVQGVDANCKYGIEKQFNLPLNQWRLLSLPATPPPSANTIEAIFGDDLDGNYGTDWLIYMFDEGAGEYFMPAVNDVIEPGRGFWIIRLAGSGSILDMPVGTVPTPVVQHPACADPIGCFPRPLTPRSVNSANLIGSPFYTIPTWQDQRLSTSGGQCADTDGCTLTEAADTSGANLMWGTRISWNGTSYQPAGFGGNIVPWAGYWIAMRPPAEESGPILFMPRY